METKKTKRKEKKTAGQGWPAAAHKNETPHLLREEAVAYELDEAPMVRTQIYLSKPEHEFIQAEAMRQGQPMAAVIRTFIDEKMEIPEIAWTDNPMLRPTPHDPDWIGHKDGAINHDHYVYGGPKKWIKVNGEVVEAPPLPEDYYSNGASRQAYDRKIGKLDESR